MPGYLGTLELLGQITALANTIPLTSRAMQAPTQAWISDGSETAIPPDDIAAANGPRP